MNKGANKKSSVRSFTVTEKAPLLEFLISSQPGKPRGKIKSEMEHGLVTVGGKAVTRFNYTLNPGQIVNIGVYTPKYGAEKSSELNIIFENDEFLVIDKPSGMLAIADDKERERTAYHLASEYVRMENARNRIFIVHRLDRDTSGIMLFAKNEDIKHALQDNWDKLVKLRSYIAVTEGTPEPPQGRIENHLRETESHLVYAAKSGDGKLAVTNYKVLKSNDTYALVGINIETGRKNQIRVHMKGLCCPVAGDKKYGASTNPVHRLCLHSDKLIISHPYTNEKMIFEASVPRKIMKAFAMGGKRYQSRS